MVVLKHHHNQHTNLVIFFLKIL
eukprot:TCALIF_06656-PA protein Name:"Protein of unknown function" AED:0.06 eAED:0.06 QI:160/1/0.5/1/1/1/2/0/22